MLNIFLKRLHLNFLTLRFWLGSLLLLLLSVPAILVGSGEYVRKMTLYTAKRDAGLAEMKSESVVTYSRTKTMLSRPPEELSIIARGLGEDCGSVVTIFGKYGPSQITSRDRSNFFLPVSTAFDHAFITAMVLSLMAIFLAYDSIAGEREQGTLLLSLANQTPRFRILLGEYLGTLVSVIAPCAAAFVALVTFIYLKGLFEINSGLFLRLLLFFIYETVLISTFTLLGLLASSLARSSLTALMLAFLFWSTIVIIYPSAANWAGGYLKPLDKIAVVSTANTITLASGSSTKQTYDANIERQKEVYGNQNFEQAQFVNSILRLSPFSNSTLAVEAIAGTDLASHERFLQRAKALEQAFTRWQEAKVRQYPLREQSYQQAYGQLDLSEMPEANYEPEDLRSLLARLAPSIATILIWNIVLFLTVNTRFIRYDPRFG